MAMSSINFGAPKTSQEAELIQAQASGTANWTEERVLKSGDESFDAILQLIAGAKSSVDYEVYIYNRDACGNAVTEALGQAAQRGVQVRLLVDGIGAFGFSNTYRGELIRAGVQVKIYHPTPYDFKKRPLFWWIPYGKILGRINNRNHRKVLIVDKASVIVGSVNVTSDHLSVARRGKGFRDTSVQLRGESISLFQVAFDRSWRYANKIALTPAPEIPLVPILFNFSSRLRRLRYLLLLELFYRADHRIWITNAYFVPDGSLLKALRFSAWTGVDVRIIVPRQSDIFFIRMVSSAFYLGLLTAGVRIFEYTASILHAKTIIMDQLGVIGTSNLNHRSLLHDLEVDVILKNQDSVKTLADAFGEDLQNCREVTLKEWESRPFFERFVGNILLLMRYWL